MSKQYQQAAEREFPMPKNFSAYTISSPTVVSMQRAAYIKACEHMEAAASELVRALENVNHVASGKSALSLEQALKEIQYITNQALAGYPKVGEEGKEAKEFVEWIRNGNWTQSKTTDELYQSFKQNK